MLVDEQSISQALLSSDSCDDSRPIITTTAVSVAELPSGITDSLNVAAKQLSFLYESVVGTNTTEEAEELNEDVSHRSEEISSGFVEVYTEQETGSARRHANRRR